MTSVTSATTGNEFYESLGISQVKTSETKGYNDLKVADFLDLMVAEITNQNPTKPMDNAELASQMAQFASVSGLDELNTSFDGLADSLTSNQALQAANLVGHEVTVPSDVAYMSSGGSVSGEIPLDTDASAMTVRISDSSGNLVREFSLGAQQAGAVPFKWDGMSDIGEYAPTDNYFIDVQATIDGEPQSLMPSINAKVDSVTLNSSGAPSLNILGLGTVSLNDVTEIR